MSRPVNAEALRALLGQVEALRSQLLELLDDEPANDEIQAHIAASRARRAAARGKRGAR